MVPPLTDEQLEDFSKQSNLKLQDINGEQKIITDNQSTDITKNGSHHKPEDTVFGIWSLEKG